MIQPGHKYIWFLVIVMLASIAVSFFFRDTLGFLENRDQFESFVKQFGVLAPIVLVLTIIVEVLVAPLPGGIAPLAAGFLFGPFLGVLYSWIGNIVGSAMAFALARRFGEPVIRFFSPSFNREHYSEILQKNSKFFWLLYAVPAVPVDVLSFAIGVSAISLKRFLYIISSAYLVRMTFWVLLGEAISNLIFV